MSATQATANGLVYSSKAELEKAENGIPAKLAQDISGHSGWRRNSIGTVEELVYLVTPGAAVAAWVTKEEHRQNVKRVRDQNRQFYLGHPALLRKKIKLRNDGPDLFSHRC